MPDAPERTLWRISNYAALDGTGGLHVSGRWHTRGRLIFYCSEHPAGALTEMLVHLDREEMPDTFRLLRIVVKETAPTQRLEEADLPANWRANVTMTRALGDAWLASRTSLLLDVPSALVPFSRNILVNPQHPAISEARIVETLKVPLDPRFA